MSNYDVEFGRKERSPQKIHENLRRSYPNYDSAQVRVSILLFK